MRSTFGSSSSSNPSSANTRWPEGCSKTPAPADKVTFQDVVAYLHGVTDAVQAMQKSCLSVLPDIVHGSASANPQSASDAGAVGHDAAAKTRLTLRHHALATAELREAHREAWAAYLGRLVIRAAGGDPGPDPHA